MYKQCRLKAVRDGREAVGTIVAERARVGAFVRCSRCPKETYYGGDWEVVQICSGIFPSKGTLFFN